VPALCFVAVDNQFERGRCFELHRAVVCFVHKTGSLKSVAQPLAFKTARWAAGVNGGLAALSATEELHCALVQSRNRVPMEAWHALRRWIDEGAMQRIAVAARIVRQHWLVAAGDLCAERRLGNSGTRLLTSYEAQTDTEPLE